MKNSKISTSALSKKLDMNSKELFQILNKKKLLFKNNKNWTLTQLGKEYGGETIFNKKFGEFVVWPDDFNPINLESSTKTKLINATKIGEALNVSSQRVNRVIAELGWIEKGIKGWKISKIGKNLNGAEYTHDSGSTYVLWPDAILNNATLIKAFNLAPNKEKENNVEDKPQLDIEVKNGRDKWPTPYRTKDGHRVRSRGEQMIDDYLYECGIVHAYEREVKNIEEKLLCDFFIPAQSGGEQVYIEYWGKEDEKYDLRRKEKTNIYRENNLNLIEIENEDIFSLDDHLPRKLLHFKIRTD